MRSWGKFRTLSARESGSPAKVPAVSASKLPLLQMNCGYFDTLIIYFLYLPSTVAILSGKLEKEASAI